MTDLGPAIELLSPFERILVFTGAGISTESGIPDFRGPGGLWTKVDPDDFTIQRFVRNRALRVRNWQMHARGELWGARSSVRPNRAHLAVVDLHRAGRLAGCVTQNIDGLHQVAGLAPDAVAEVHGNVRTVVCLGCAALSEIEVVLQRVDAGEDDPSCPDCGGMLKTSTIMFGEELPEAEFLKAWEFADDAGAVVVVGSTVGVYPAASIPLAMASEGKPLIVVNQGPTEADLHAQLRLDGAAGDILPRLFAAITER
ncbi:NAD-dependent protein deacetylase [soil metagenome]